VHAYSTTDWETFFGAIVGATAALTGLLFVAVSLNLEHILKGPWFLTRRAAETLATLLFVLYSAAMVLVPQNSRLLGVEILVVVIPFSAVTLRSQLDHLRGRPDDPKLWLIGRTMTTTICTLPGFLAGISLVLQWGGGIYWLVPAALLGIAGAVFSAWVLLVEIVR
jgi:hypothetical protein